MIFQTLKARQTFARQVFWTLVIQGSGAVLAFATVAWLGRTQGPVSQGVFSRTKTELEFLASVASLGLPQALMYFAQTRRLSIARGLRISAAAALLGAVGAVAYGLARGDGLAVVAVAAAVFTMVWQGNVRTILLGVSTARSFNLATAGPQALVLLWVLAAAPALGMSTGVAAGGYALAFGIVAVVAGAMLFRHPVPEITHEVHPRQLASYGVATWISAMAVTGSLLACTLYVDTSLGARALGLFTATVVLAQVALTPLNYLLPLLLKRWVASTGHRRWPYLVAGTAPPLIAALALRVIGTSWATGRLGDYGRIGDALWLVCVIVALEVGVRLLAADQLAKGRPWAPAAADLARVASVAAVLVLARPGGFLAVVGVWGAASLCALVALVLLELQSRRADIAPQAPLLDRVGQ
jgi:O-antigen/teichoic acid export membrane protein